MVGTLGAGMSHAKATRPRLAAWARVEFFKGGLSGAPVGEALPLSLGDGRERSRGATRPAGAGLIVLPLTMEPAHNGVSPLKDHEPRGVWWTLGALVKTPISMASRCKTSQGV